MELTKKKIAPIGLFMLGIGFAVTAGVFLMPQMNGLPTVPAAPPAPSPTTTPWYNNLDPAHRESERQYEEDRQNALKSPMPRPRPKPLPTLIVKSTPFIAVPHRSAGAGILIDDGFAPFTSSVYVTNQWLETLADGVTINVYAGARRSDGAFEFPPAFQGLVIVIVSGTKGGYGPEVETPSRVGAVKITDVQGERLILAAEDRGVLYFDVPGRRFVLSLEEIVPTATPKR